MDWSPPVLWWLAAGLLVVAELLSGTFYLLMLALGCAVGALVAHGGASPTLQWLAAALSGAGATALWHLRRARSPRSAPAAANRDVNLDIGERVVVRAWASDHTTRVHHRGSAWTARLAPGATPRAGVHTIVAVHGNQLELAPLDPAPAAGG